MEHPGFLNQDLIPAMSLAELKEVSDIKEIKRSLYATISYLENRERAIFSTVRARQGGGDTSPIVTKLKITIVQLFEICNQSITISYTCPATMNLTGQMESRLHSCIDTLSQIIDEIKPERVDPLPLPPNQAGLADD